MLLASEGSMRRYKILPSESGLWSVIDSLTGLPAERYGRPLTGMTRYEAEEAAFNLSESTPPWMALVRRRRP
ncbi:conserved hypothetical protein [Mesorhizobium escarrei]|nr:conserved hypothetical protein [Mesorhizobium escarrei]